MTTTYYCPTCAEKFEEDKLPNIHKTHDCGSYARIVIHDKSEEEDEE